MNRKLIVSILAIILAITMVLSLVLAALPANVFGSSILEACGNVCISVPMLPAIAV